MWFLNDDEYIKLLNNEIVEREFVNHNALIYKDDDFINIKINNKETKKEYFFKMNFNKEIDKKLFIFRFARFFDDRMIYIIMEEKKNI